MDDFISIKEVSKRIGGQNQHNYYALKGIGSYPKSLGEDIRFIDNGHSYHEVLIHKDDIDKFVMRLQKWNNFFIFHTTKG